MNLNKIKAELVHTYLYFKTVKRLKFWTEKLGSVSRAEHYLKNRAIDKVVNNWESQQPIELYYARLYESRALTQDRADHYAVNIGDVVHTYRKRRPEYIAELAKYKKMVWLTAKGLIGELNEVV